MKKRRQTKASRTFIAVSVCIVATVVAASLFMILRAGRGESSQPQATWSSISSVRIDFDAMVTNRNITVGAEVDPVMAELSMKEMYFNENDFVLPFNGRVSCSKGTANCSIEVRAPVCFEKGRIHAGELKLGAFVSHDFDLGQDEKFVAATLFAMIKGKIEILPLEVDRDFKAVHAINNDFIEFEK